MPAPATFASFSPFSAQNFFASSFLNSGNAEVGFDGNGRESSSSSTEEGGVVSDCKYKVVSGSGAERASWGEMSELGVMGALLIMISSEGLVFEGGRGGGFEKCGVDS